MNKVEKTKLLSLRKANAEADIGLINQYSLRELTPAEVYCFSVVLCDSEVDRDMERFPKASLDALAPLFNGKTGISDHRWSAEKQIARLYRTEVEKAGGTNSLGEELYVLRGDAYILNTEANKNMIDAIDGGIVKEVSVGCAMSKCVCSICGEPFELNWRTWNYECANDHAKGQTYDGKLCVGDLVDPVDAYEFSFVAIPAQRGAGVTKSATSLDDAFFLLLSADIGDYGEQAKQLMPRLQSVLTGAAEREERVKILSENKKFLTKREEKV